MTHHNLFESFEHEIEHKLPVRQPPSCIQKLSGITLQGFGGDVNNLMN